MLMSDKLSWRAIGILNYIHEKEGKDITIEKLSELSSDGKDAVRTAMSELINLGFVERIRLRDGSSFGKCIYEVKV